MFSFLLMNGMADGQTPFIGMKDSLPLSIGNLNNKTKSDHNYSSKSALDFWIDLDSTDSYNQAQSGNMYQRRMWRLNTNYDLSDTSSIYPAIRSVTVAFDTIIDSDDGIPIGYSHFPILIDSIIVMVGQENNSGIDDTLIFQIIKLDSNNYPSDGINNNLYWVDTIIIPYNISISGNWLNSVPIGFPVFLGLYPIDPSDKFCVKVQYYGSKLDTFGIMAGYPARLGSGNCTSDTLAMKSGFYPNSYTDYLRTNYNIGGVYPTSTGQDIFYDCNGNSIYDSLIDGDNYIQNAQISVKIEPYSIGIPSISNGNSFNIYPNPVTSILTIHQSTPSTNQQLIITDVLGNEVYHQAINNSNNQTIDISNLSSGVYFFVVRGERGEERGKFVKQ